MKLACALFLGVMCYLVLGCGAALSEKECINADWRMIGLEDGMRGKSMLSLSGYRKACSEVDVVPDLAAYEQGHNDGLKHYCVYQTGYNLGPVNTNLMRSVAAKNSLSRRAERRLVIPNKRQTTRRAGFWLQPKGLGLYFQADALFFAHLAS